MLHSLETSSKRAVLNFKLGEQQTFFCIRPPPELLPVLGMLEWYMTLTLEAALLCSSRAGHSFQLTIIN